MHSVLIADGEAPVRRILSLQLERAGFEVVAVACAEDALDALSQRAFSAMVTDICMPGLSGPGLREAIRSEGRHVSMPVVVITSRPEAELGEWTKELGAVELMQKPVSIRGLIGRVHDLLGPAKSRGHD